MTPASIEPSTLPYWQEVADRTSIWVEPCLFIGGAFVDATRDGDPPAVCDQSNTQSNTVWKQWSQ